MTAPVFTPGLVLRDTASEHCMIVEVRTYRVKPGLRDRFIEFFHRHAIPLQRAKGMTIAGPFLDTEDRDVFIWLRGFPSLDERDRMKRDLYEGEEWKSELEAIAMAMLDDFSSVLTTTTAGFVDDLADAASATRLL